MLGWFIFWCCLATGATWYDWKTTQDVLALGGREKNKWARWVVARIGWRGKLIFDLVAVLGGALVLTGVTGYLQVGLVWLMLTAILQGHVGLKNAELAREMKDG